MNSGNFFTTEKFRVLALAAVAFAVMLPVLIFGLPSGHDLPHHYQCAMTFAESIKSGDLYPSWSLNRNFGFGGMETRLYPPASHYVLALAHLATGEWHIASWIVFTLFSFLGALGVYLWAKESLTPEKAVFAGCLYALMPYHLNQIYNTFFYAEFVGASLIPFTFLYISRVCRRGGWASCPGLAASLALLVLTHLPLAVIGAVCFTIYALSLLDRTRLVEQLTGLAFGVGLALTATAFFIVKVVTEKNLMARTTVYPEPMFDYHLNFLLTPIQHYEGIGLIVFENSTTFYDKMLYLPLIVVLVAAIPFVIAARRIERELRGVWFVLMVATFLTIPQSEFLWNLIGPLQEIQFPWRFLTIVSLASSVVAASQLDCVAGWFRTSKRPYALIVGGVFLALVTYSVAQVIRPAMYVEKSSIEAFMTKTAGEQGLEFWWPVDVRKGFEENATKIDAPDRTVTPIEWTATSKVFSVSPGAVESNARVAVFYHPDWNVFFDGSQVQTIARPRPDDHGVLTITVPKQGAMVEIKFTEPSSSTSLRWMSAIAWLFLPILWIVYRFRRHRRPNTLPT